MFNSKIGKTFRSMIGWYYKSYKQIESLKNEIRNTEEILENGRREIQILNDKLTKQTESYKQKQDFHKKELEAAGQKWCVPDKNNSYMYIGSDGRRMTFEEMMSSGEYVFVFE